MIVKAWNNVENEHLEAVAQQVVNTYKIEVGDEVMQTAWVLIVKKSKYKYDQAIVDQCHYFEYELPGEYLFIIARSYRQTSNEKIKRARNVRNHFIE